ncbi:MAG: ribbon-helix-helix protein, CopG family [Acidobacteriota bacterium]
MSPNLKPATFRLDRHLLEALQAIKERDGIPVTEQVRRALTAWVQTKDIPMKAAPRRASTRRKA